MVSWSNILAVKHLFGQDAFPVPLKVFGQKSSVKTSFGQLSFSQTSLTPFYISVSLKSIFMAHWHLLLAIRKKTLDHTIELTKPWHVIFFRLYLVNSVCKLYIPTLCSSIATWETHNSTNELEIKTSYRKVSGMNPKQNPSKINRTTHEIEREMLSRGSSNNSLHTAAIPIHNERRIRAR